MPLRDLIKKKDRLDKTDGAASTQLPPLPQASDFTFVRTDTHTETPIQVPGGEDQPYAGDASPSAKLSPGRRSLGGRLRKSVSPAPSDSSTPDTAKKEHRRLSQRLHLNRDRSASTSSVNLPSDLPAIEGAYSDAVDRQETEAKWEERATILATKSPVVASVKPPTGDLEHLSLGAPGASPRRPSSVNDPDGDLDIQKAIDLHEAGELEQATDMFRRLAEAGNVLSQVLYGLSLRHGWGCAPDPPRAVEYLSAAASNSAAIEADALKAGLKKGGAAKGELVLAIFELANCFRHGWGVPVDKVAARHYYETAANLGDTDAMNEAAWCYLEGFGGKKDKLKAAQLLRLAEKNGAKTLGNTWIWKEKYDPPK